MRKEKGAGAARRARATRSRVRKTLTHPNSHLFFLPPWMSRLVVKNLPSYITPTLLKEHFSQSKGPHGTITDVKVILKQDGTARRFGFVGFKTDEEALKAKEWYDKTFIDSTRVRVEIIDVGVLLSLSVAS